MTSSSSSSSNASACREPVCEPYCTEAVENERGGGREATLLSLQALSLERLTIGTQNGIEAEDTFAFAR